MADTTKIYLVDGQTFPFDSLPDSLKQLATEVWQVQLPSQKNDQPDYSPYVLLFIAIIGAVTVKRAWKARGTTILGGPNEPHGGASAAEKREELLRDYFVYEGRDISIDEAEFEKILSRHSAYYRRLLPGLKEAFIRRTRKFLSAKTFLIKHPEPYIEMPVLVSATAIQLSFGLQDYLLPHYAYIRIYPQEYLAKHRLGVLAGHVYGNTITLSWRHFLDGHQDSGDGVNLGLHEMAHAFYVQQLNAGFFRNSRFEEGFTGVMTEGKEMFELKQSRPSVLFSEYAYKDLQEFWAESVELFFERPAELKRENTELYLALVDLLKQDPVSGMHPLTG